MAIKDASGPQGTFPAAATPDMVALRWLKQPGGPAIELLDQTRLPAVETFVRCTDVGQLVDAIGRLVVRGAPLLGVAGAFGVALAAARGDDVEAAARALSAARPTAVNLSRGVRQALSAYLAADGRAAETGSEPVPGHDRGAQA